MNVLHSVAKRDGKVAFSILLVSYRENHIFGKAQLFQTFMDELFLALINGVSLVSVVCVWGGGKGGGGGRREFVCVCVCVCV